MKTTNHSIDAELQAWPDPELPESVSRRTLTRARAALVRHGAPDRARLTEGVVVPALLGLAAAMVLADTVLKAWVVFGG